MKLKIRGPSTVYVLIVILCMHRNDLLVMLQDDSITDKDKSIKLHNISRNYKCDDMFLLIDNFHSLAYVTWTISMRTRNYK